MMREMVTRRRKFMIRTTDGNPAGGRQPARFSRTATGQRRGTAQPRRKRRLRRPLVDYKDKGNRIELAGREKIGNAPLQTCYLHEKRENRIDYIDCKSYLEVKWQGLVSGNLLESYFRDYRPVKASCTPSKSTPVAKESFSTR